MLAVNCYSKREEDVWVKRTRLGWFQCLTLLLDDLEEVISSLHASGDTSASLVYLGKCQLLRARDISYCGLEEHLAHQCPYLRASRCSGITDEHYLHNILLIDCYQRVARAFYFSGGQKRLACHYPSAKHCWWRHGGRGMLQPRPGTKINHLIDSGSIWAMAYNSQLDKSTDIFVPHWLFIDVMFFYV